jgi:hypothetical protein
VMHKYLVGVGQIGGEVVLEQGSEFLMSLLIFLNNYETSQVAYAKTEIKREGEREREIAMIQLIVSILPKFPPGGSVQILD